ncbi:hypothetical protein [Radiobacillus sp. PE A8.2]|uniref:hypothetical protein n=1 Tax=Radiobacillus sp. PE A8.2 TaxID=3380349 RepID=UPI00388DECE3
MDLLLIYLLFFSFMPFILWTEHLRKTAIALTILVIGAWVSFANFAFAGGAADSNLIYLLILFATFIYGHISFVQMILQIKKSLSTKSIFPFIQSNN